MLEKGLDDDNDNDDKSNGEDMSWWCRHQFANPTQARLAKTYLAIPASSAAPERGFLAAGNVVTKKRDKLGDDTVDALLMFLDGSHGLACQAESRRRRSAGRTSNSSLSCGGDGWVREYVHKLFRVALCSIIYILC